MTQQTLLGNDKVDNYINNNLKLLVIQPRIANYRLPLYSSLFTYFRDVVFFCGEKNTIEWGKGYLENTYYGSKVKLFNNSIYRQKGLFGIIKKERPNIIFSYCDLNNIDTYLLCIYRFIYKYEIFFHSQGAYKHESRLKEITRKTINTFLIFFSKKYLTYSSQTILNNSYLLNKRIDYIENTIVNDYNANSIRSFIGKLDILFIGRTRKNSEIELILQAINNLTDVQKENITLSIIGDGERMNDLLRIVKEYHLQDRIVFYGAIYNQREITNIALRCNFGIYAGDAGLSIIHYASMSLPIIMHNDSGSHMGPEPLWFINNNVGYFFERGNVDSLKVCLSKLLLLSKKDYANISKKSYARYQELINESFGLQLASKI